MFFFFLWTVVGLMPWAAAAIATRGRGAAVALPLAVVGAWAVGILVPALGLRDFTGFIISLFTAALGSLLGTVAGVVMWRRLDAAREKPAVRTPPLVKRRDDGAAAGDAPEIDPKA